jgi:serine/threonine protein kinase
MEFVEGEDLWGRITTRGRLSEADAVAIIAQVAQGLHHAHERGVVHRDVKPDNILLLPDGRAKLADFGLVKDLESDLNLTETATVLGTPNFMAPEQFENSKKVDRRADVYALAATLYMAVTGELPFNARGYLSTMRKKLSGELTAPRQLAPELSEHLEAVILRAMALDPVKRPATCQVFAEELAAQPEAPPAPARPSRPTLARRKETFKGRDRRNATRFPCNLESSCLPIGGEADKPWKARIKDISARGIGLLMTRRFEPGTVLLLELQGEPRPLGPSRLLVRVMRVKEQSGRQWLVGCQLAYKLCPSELQGLQSAAANGKAVPFWLMTQPETLTGAAGPRDTPAGK